MQGLRVLRVMALFVGHITNNDKTDTQIKVSEKR